MKKLFVVFLSFLWLSCNGEEGPKNWFLQLDSPMFSYYKAEYDKSDSKYTGTSFGVNMQSSSVYSLAPGREPQLYLGKRISENVFLTGSLNLIKTDFEIAEISNYTLGLGAKIVFNSGTGFYLHPELLIGKMKVEDGGESSTVAGGIKVGYDYYLNDYVSFGLNAGALFASTTWETETEDYDEDAGEVITKTEEEKIKSFGFSAGFNAAIHF